MAYKDYKDLSADERQDIEEVAYYDAVQTAVGWFDDVAGIDYEIGAMRGEFFKITDAAAFLDTFPKAQKDYSIISDDEYKEVEIAIADLNSFGRCIAFYTDEENELFFSRIHKIEETLQTVCHNLWAYYETEEGWREYYECNIDVFNEVWQERAERESEEYWI